ncbi:hypothetical protein [Nostoc sp. UHCC 0870]|uniref:hypothetical protein n=1 Tax=Nostoc sp. UHCC 0870 TaxID=2914041 RepID=UPI001EDED73E|nr:hypothetical protein [Nostoc sp. UHCC 0870]UKO99379.1 hypothetical protein L6494_06600 [Nostoc sp. UHCC 0870]
MKIIDKLSELSDANLILVVFLVCVTGGGVVGLISEAWKISEKRQQEEEARQVCEKMRNLRNVTIERMNKGYKISPAEAGAAYQIGIMTSEGCEPIK